MSKDKSNSGLRAQCPMCDSQELALERRQDGAVAVTCGDCDTVWAIDIVNTASVDAAGWRAGGRG